MHVYTEPYAGAAPIVQLIQSARKEVNLEVYYLSDRKILDALKAADARGVKVRIILEKKPYKMPSWKVSREMREAQATGATVQWAPRRFTSHGSYWAFEHAKFVCNAHACEIGSANYGWDDFHRNRDYLVTTKNVRVVSAANDVFDADWNNRHAPAYAHQVLVLSPGTSAAQLLKVINQPGPIDIESEEMGPYRPTLDAIAAKGHLARVILPASINWQDKKDVAYLRRHGVQVRLMPVHPTYVHAKMICGSQLGFVGSENFTQTSLESNREMGLIMHNAGNLQKLRAQFNRDWQAAG